MRVGFQKIKLTGSDKEKQTNRCHGTEVFSSPEKFCFA